MDSILQQITDWLKEMLVSAIMGNLSGMFESVNNQVGEIATSVGMTPANFSPGVFAMVRNISESVIIPIAGLILTFIACYELIQMIIDHNNLANFETWIFFKWVFKTFVAVMLITNTFNITMAVFDVTQHVINPYVWGGSSPSTSFDCSGFVSYVINHCGNGWSVGRLTANGLMGVCDIIPKSSAKPGDLIFFQGTYDTSGASHVGIYVGNGMMIHCGNPISYASIESNYWQQHFYCFGRIRN